MQWQKGQGIHIFCYWSTSIFFILEVDLCSGRVSFSLMFLKGRNRTVISSITDVKNVKHYTNINLHINLKNKVTDKLQLNFLSFFLIVYPYYSSPWINKSVWRSKSNLSLWWKLPFASLYIMFIHVIHLFRRFTFCSDKVFVENPRLNWLGAFQAAQIHLYSQHYKDPLLAFSASSINKKLRRLESVD